MIEAVMLWNEPNNKSHWDPEVDPEWRLYGDMVKHAARAVKDMNPGLVRVLGGMSPIDPIFVDNMRGQGVLDHVEVVAVHGFPLDWNLWSIHEWPERITEIQAAAPNHQIWVTEVGVGSFGAEEVQIFGVDKTAELLIGRVPRIFWYSLYDLPQEWGATTRHREAEGSSYYRHFYMGLIRADGTPKPALENYGRVADRMGLMQWFHFEDPRLDEAVRWMKRLGVRHLRTGLSWADSFRPGADAWFDRMMEALADFEVTITFCFTPEHLGHEPHHTSAPREPERFADFCASMIERYAPAHEMSLTARP